jgi:subtilisin-like proprotein convertase family protein
MRHAFFLLLLATPAMAGSPVVRCDELPTPIADDSGAVLQINVNLGPPNGLSVQTLELDLSVDHPWVGDLRITLRAPDGTSVTILDRPGLANPPSFAFPGPHGCGGDDIDAVFTDAAAGAAQETCSATAVPVLAGPLRPAEPLAEFAGLPASGVWTLTIADLGPTDSGEFTRACLRIGTTAACPADLDAPFGVLNFFDLSAYLALYSAQDPRADLAVPNGVFNFFDVSAYLASYNAGCP